MKIKRVKCERCRKYILVKKMILEIEVFKDQLIIIHCCPYCQSILIAEIFTCQWKYIEVLGKSG